MIELLSTETIFESMCGSQPPPLEGERVGFEIITEHQAQWAMQIRAQAVAVRNAERKAVNVYRAKLDERERKAETAFRKETAYLEEQLTKWAEREAAKNPKKKTYDLFCGKISLTTRKAHHEIVDEGTYLQQLLDVYTDKDCPHALKTEIGTLIKVEHKAKKKPLNSMSIEAMQKLNKRLWEIKVERAYEEMSDDELIDWMQKNRGQMDRPLLAGVEIIPEKTRIKVEAENENKKEEI